MSFGAQRLVTLHQAHPFTKQPVQSAGVVQSTVGGGLAAPLPHASAPNQSSAVTACLAIRHFIGVFIIRDFARQGRVPTMAGNRRLIRAEVVFISRPALFHENRPSTRALTPPLK